MTQNPDITFDFWFFLARKNIATYATVQCLSVSVTNRCSIETAGSRDHAGFGTEAVSGLVYAVLRECRYLRSNSTCTFLRKSFFEVQTLTLTNCNCWAEPL